MLRELKVQEFKPVRCDLKADSNLKTGMGVVLDLANSEVAFPSSASYKNIYVVDKERNSVVLDNRIQRSDYYTEYNEWAAGEVVKVKHYNRGERFAVDQYDTGTYTAGTTYLTVGTDGKWEAYSAGSGDPATTPYLCGGTMNDNGHTLLIIDVVE